MIKKAVQMRNIIVALLFGECTLLFGLYLLFNTSLLFILSIYAFIKNIILCVLLAYLAYLIETNNTSVAAVLDTDAKNAFLFHGQVICLKN